MMNRSLRTVCTLVFLFSLVLTASAQHSLQIDNGGGAYSTIFGSAPGGTYTLPAGGGAILTNYSAPGSPALVWLTVGNAYTNPATHFIGTTDNQPVIIKVNNQRVMRYDIDATFMETNLTGGSPGNAISSTGTANTISGGGASIYPNIISGSGNYHTISGGGNNLISGTGGTNTIGGGGYNQVINNATRATVVGGGGNTASANGAFVGGGGVPGGVAGSNNTASGVGSTIVAGVNNRATDDYGFVGGGENNQAGDNAGTSVDRSHATVAGGTGNTAGGNFSTVGGGTGNSASNYSATVAGGYSSTASAFAATVAGGISNQAIDNAAFIGGGENNIASGHESSISGGFENTSSGAYSAVSGGREALAAKSGQHAQANGSFSTKGDAQTSVYVMRIETTDATTTDMFLDGISQRLVLPMNSTYAFSGVVSARTATGQADGWEIKGTIDNNGGAYTYLGGSTTNIGFGLWTVNVNILNNCLNIEVTGAAATTIRWVARIETAEVTF